jgi:hypothetical protein
LWFDLHIGRFAEIDRPTQASANTSGKDQAVAAKQDLLWQWGISPLCGLAQVLDSRFGEAVAQPSNRTFASGLAGRYGFSFTGGIPEATRHPSLF